MEMAIQIERNGREYYSMMLERSENEEVKKVFDFLGREEQSHLDNFLKIRQKLAESSENGEIEIADEYNTPEMIAYLTALFDGRVFPNLNSHAEIAREIKTDEQAVYHAIGFEKDTVLFFQEILNILGPADQNRPLVEELIRQEKIHIARLYTLLGNLK